MTRPTPDPAEAAKAYAASASDAPEADDRHEVLGDAAAQDAVDALGDDDLIERGVAEPFDAEPPTIDGLQQELAETQIALSMALAERDEYLADLQRKAAELSNVLKREHRNAGVGRIDGRMDVMRALLDVLDDFDRTAMAAVTSQDEGLRSGVGLVHDKLAAALTAQGLVRSGEPGEPFDPNRHEAVHQVEAEDGPLDEPVVHEVFRPGYRVGDRVLRAAMVVVRQ